MVNMRLVPMVVAAFFSMVVVRPAVAETILVNLGDTPYTSDGSGNTWQTFDLNNLSNVFVAVSPATVLNNTTGAASGISLELTADFSDFMFSNAGPTQAAFDAPAVGVKPVWFDSSAAEQRETYAWGPTLSLTFVFTGFATSDVVQFDYVMGLLGNGEIGRKGTITYQVSGDILNDVVVSDVANYGTIGGLTGFTSYSFTALSSGTLFGGGVNAVGITIASVPEPGMFLLSSLAVAGAYVLRRRRLRV